VRVKNVNGLVHILELKIECIATKRNIIYSSFTFLLVIYFLLCTFINPSFSWIAGVTKYKNKELEKEISNYLFL
jgi:hypothetical protein